MKVGEELPDRSEFVPVAGSQVEDRPSPGAVGDAAPVVGAALDPMGNNRIGFEATATINRKDWGITWNAALETGGVLVSEKITLDVDISAIKRSSSS